MHPRGRQRKVIGLLVASIALGLLIWAAVVLLPQSPETAEITETGGAAPTAMPATGASAGIEQWRDEVPERWTAREDDPAEPSQQAALMRDVQEELREKGKALANMTEYDPILCIHTDSKLCPPFDQPDEELQRMADCGAIKIDAPGFFYDSEAPLIDGRWTDTVELSEAERRALQRALSRLRSDIEGSVRNLYAEVTGDTDDAGKLDLAGLNQMFRFDRPAGYDLAMWRVAAERAGRAEASATADPVLRYLRLATSLGDEVEREIAAVLGEEKARAMRKAANGWGTTIVSTQSCPDERALNESLQRLSDHIDRERAGQESG